MDSKTLPPRWGQQQLREHERAAHRARSMARRHQDGASIKELARWERVSYEVMRRIVKRGMSLLEDEPAPEPDHSPTPRVQITEAGTEMPASRPWRSSRGTMPYYRITRAEQEAAAGD